MRRSRFGLALVAIATVGGIGRYTMLVAVPSSPGGDGFFYPIRAQALADGHGFVFPLPVHAPDGALVYRPSAGYPPLWTLVLSITGHRTNLDYLPYQITAMLIGVVTIVVVGLAAKEIAGPRVGLIAAGLAAVYPGFWVYERGVLSETLLLLVVAVMVLLAYRYHRRPSLAGAVLLGAAWMINAMTRAEQILLWPLLVVPLILTTAGLAWRNRLGRLAIATVVGLAILAPWTIYNAGRFEGPVLLSNGLGNAMSAADCDAGFNGELLGYYDVPTCNYARPVTSTDEVVADAQHRTIAIDYLRAHLTEVPRVVVAREGRTFGLFRPGQTMDLYLKWTGASPRLGGWWVWSYWVLAVAAIGGVVQLRRRKIIIYPLLAFVITVVFATAITFGFIRYRAAAEVTLVILAAVGIDAGAGWLLHRVRGAERAADAPEPSEPLIEPTDAPAMAEPADPSSAR